MNTIHLVARTDMGDYDTPFEDHIVGAYRDREDAEAKLAEVLSLFDADHEAWRGREREIRRLARGWIAETGVLDGDAGVPSPASSTITTRWAR